MKATIYSTGSGDVRHVTIHGRDPHGQPSSELLTLNGTTRVIGGSEFRGVHSVEVDAVSPSETVHVTRNDTPIYTHIVDIAPNVKRVIRG